MNHDSPSACIYLKQTNKNSTTDNNETRLSVRKNNHSPRIPTRNIVTKRKQYWSERKYAFDQTRSRYRRGLSGPAAGVMTAPLPTTTPRKGGCRLWRADRRRGRRPAFSGDEKMEMGLDKCGHLVNSVDNCVNNRLLCGVVVPNTMSASVRGPSSAGITVVSVRLTA